MSVRTALLPGAFLALVALGACGSGERNAAPETSPPVAAGADTSAVEIPTAPPGDVFPEAPLEGTEWRLVALPGAPDPPPGALATLVLEHEGGIVRGSTGCNGFDGSWKIAGTRVTLGLGALGTTPCGPELGRLETDYVEALRRAGSYRLRGDTLELLGAQGVVARFEAP
jgi:heat shock protein HslJ